MLPMGDPGSDAESNILEGFVFLSALAEQGRKGISIAFHGHLIHGPRSQKILSHDSTAFSSINYHELGCITSGNAVLGKEPFLAETYPWMFLPSPWKTPFSSLPCSPVSGHGTSNT
jgi:L-asparaginase